MPSPEQIDPLQVNGLIRLPNDIARAGLALLAAYVLTVVFLAGLGTWFTLSEREETLHEARKSMSAHGRSVAEQVSRMFGEVDRELSALAMQVVERGGIDLIDPVTLRGYASVRQHRLRQVQSILVADAMGRVVIETGTAAASAEKQAQWESVLHSQDTQAAFLALGHPISNSSTAASVIPALRRLPPVEGVADGYLVATIDPRYLMRTYPNLGLAEETTIAVDHHDGFRLLEYAHSSVVAPASATSGGERIVTKHSIPAFPLAITLTAPTDEFLRSWRSSAAIAALSIAAATMVIGLAFAWSYRILIRRAESESELRHTKEGLEYRVSQDAAALERTSYELSRVSYSISHDLRAPLRAINGFSQALEEDYGKVLDQTARDYLRRVRRASMRMGELLDGFTELSHVTRQQIAPIEVDLSAMAIEIAARLAAADPMRDVDFDIAHGVRAVADPSLARHMLNHLFTNAWKFTRDVPRARISFGVFDEDGVPVYFVDDNGVGFDMRYAAKLFAPFNRLHEEETYSGAGIGLATVKRIVELHGGQIWVEAVPGAGVTVHFTLLGAAPAAAEGTSL